MTFVESCKFVLAATACVALPATAIAQDANCISRAESQAVVAHLMPNLLKSAARYCSPTFGSGSFFAINADRLSDRLVPLARDAWPAAKRALERQSGHRLPDNEAILDLGRQAIADGIVNGMDGQACSVVDQLLTELAPLPPRNLANVFSLFLETGISNDPNSQLRVCEAG